ncbi:MAG: FecR domain-containing protein [Nitrospirae bacterium]|nr:FecR domain-containing protein [Nitrospirota bacterium]
MKIHLYAVLIALFLSAVFSLRSYSDEEAGKILAVKKNVYILRYDKRSDAKPQMAVLTEDAVVTGENSRAKIFFNDDSILSLGELSRLEVKEYIYNSEKDRSKSIYNLIDGSLRVIVGRSDLEIHTPTAVVAARGTMFIVWIDNGTHAMVFDGNVTMTDLVTGLNEISINPGEVGSFSGEEQGIVRPATPEEIEQFEDVTSVIGEVMENQNQIPEAVMLETVEQFIDNSSNEDAAPPAVDPEIAGTPPVADQVPPAALTPVTIDVIFPEEAIGP